MRKNPFVNENYYHVFNRSIAKYEIFNNAQEYNRMIELFDFYRFKDFTYRYSQFKRIDAWHKNEIIKNIRDSKKVVEIVAYCLMPTHFHVVLKQAINDGIVKYIAKILDSYSKYFNIKHKRKGPLWEGHFSSVLVSDDEQLLHLTRYLHLNPVSANLVKSPDKWKYSSYNEYINQNEKNQKNKICQFQDIIEINEKEYKKFVNDYIDYQKEIAKIKHLLIENYSG